MKVNVDLLKGVMAIKWRDDDYLVACGRSGRWCMPPALEMLQNQLVPLEPMEPRVRAALGHCRRRMHTFSFGSMLAARIFNWICLWVGRLFNFFPIYICILSFVVSYAGLNRRIRMRDHIAEYENIHMVRAARDCVVKSLPRSFQCHKRIDSARKDVQTLLKINSHARILTSSKERRRSFLISIGWN